MSGTRCKCDLFHLVSSSPSCAAWAFICIGWASEMMLIWPTSCSLSRVSMATLSSEWGHGSNWPIVSKLHFSEWFPQSYYWNRAPAPLMDTSCHSQFKRQEGRVQTWHPTKGPGGGGLLKQRNCKEGCREFAWCCSSSKIHWVDWRS